MDPISSQYNALGAEYDLMSSLPSSRLEIFTAQKIVTSLLRKEAGRELRVLDLACGTGRFTRLLLDWGADSVLGVDISAPMIEAARATTEPSLLRRGKIDLLVADGTEPIAYATTPFDFVFGAWFHACAPNKQQMLRMWENVALNLKPGGYFVGICPIPTADPMANSLRIERERPMWKGNVNQVFKEEIADGIIEKVIFLPLSSTKAGEMGEKMEIESYSLKQSVWEESAKEAGFRMPLEWRLPEIGEELVRGGGGSEEENRVWESLKRVPQMAFVVAQKT